MKETHTNDYFFGLQAKDKCEQGDFEGFLEVSGPRPIALSPLEFASNDEKVEKSENTR